VQDERACARDGDPARTFNDTHQRQQMDRELRADRFVRQLLVELPVGHPLVRARLVARPGG
jgi:hypothetical protein